MLIGIFSDTHDNLHQVAKAVKFFTEQNVQAVLHAGDIVAPFTAKLIATLPMPVHIIYGNNDGEKTGLKNVLPQIGNGPVEIHFEDKIVAMAHDFSQIPPDAQEKAHILVAGHTHQAFVKKEGEKLFINPGECGGWLKGRSSVAILDTQKMQAEIIDLPL